jgi:hypothetical protein
MPYEKPRIIDLRVNPEKVYGDNICSSGSAASGECATGNLATGFCDTGNGGRR